MIIFEKNSNAYKFITFIEKTNANFEKNFNLRFMIINQDNRYDFNYKNYLIRYCEQTSIIRLLKKHLYFNVFLKNRSF